MLYPQGTGRDLIPLIDSFDEQGCLGRGDFGSFGHFDVVALLPKSLDQVLLRGRDAIEAGQHQPAGCLHLAREHGFLQHQRQLASAQPILFAACALKAARPLAKALDIRTAQPFSVEEVEGAIGAEQGIGLLCEFRDARHGDQPAPLDTGLHQLHPDLLFLQRCE